MITPTIAQVILARAAATACLSPLEYDHWMPAQTIIMTETAMPATIKMVRALPMIFGIVTVSGLGIPPGTGTGVPLNEKARNSFMGLCNYHTGNI